MNLWINCDPIFINTQLRETSDLKTTETFFEFTNTYSIMIKEPRKVNLDIVAYNYYCVSECQTSSTIAKVLHL
jgi:hypothetical protein